VSIHKRVNKRRSVWIVRYRDPLPRERTFERKADAQRFERYVRHQLDTDQYLDPEMAKVTFEDWAQRWWPTVENSERAPSTISGYESALRIQVLPYLGERRLRTLRRIEIEEWLGELRTAGYANSTIHSARTVAGMVFTSALDDRIIASNPLAGIRVPTGTSRTRNALSVEQVEALAETVDPWWRPYVLVLAYCGLRPGEAAALRRRHLDDLGRVTVERGMTEHRGHLLERDTKTHRTRVVQVPSSVLFEVRDHLAAHVEDDPLALIFTTPSRTPVRISNWRHKVWQPAADELRLPKWATPYVLRHTAASLMAQRGVPVSAAAAALGHDPAIFLRTYAHLYPEDLRAVADAMNSARTETINARVIDRSQPIELVDRSSSLARGENAGKNRRAEGRLYERPL
jgi:integrase